MLKILTAGQLRAADEATIRQEPVSSDHLMERAASKAAETILRQYNSNIYSIFCGPGNNGGDGLVIARLLHGGGKTVSVYALAAERYSEDFKVNRLRLEDAGVIVRIIHTTAEIPVTGKCVIIDALFGSGLNKEPEGLAAALIKHINNSGNKIVSIDMPSGLFADQASKGEIIRADGTVTFQLPKLSLLLPSSGRFAGIIYIVDIGLNKAFIEQAESSRFMVQESDVKQMMKKRDPFSHKGTYGHVLLLAGSAGKTGAAILSAKACLRSGAGAVTAAMHRSGINALNAALPEAMSIASGEEHIETLPDISRFDVIACGPGIGRHADTARMLKTLIQNCREPMVLDADALNILSENKTWLSFLPPGTILTPHPKEFERLAGIATDDFERLQQQVDFSKKYQCYTILKEHHSCISTPDGHCFFNSTGNSGMATAGSGDVLTGIVAGLLAQGYSPRNAAIAGVYLHGLAGDLAAAETGEASLIASDIIGMMGRAFLKVS